MFGFNGAELTVFKENSFSWSPPVISLLAVPRRHFCFVFSWLFFLFSIARFIAIVSVLHLILALWPSGLNPAARFAFCLYFIRFVFVVHSFFFWWTKAELRARVGRPQTSSSPPVIFIAGRLFCFGSLVILDVARWYLWLFTLYINIKISKNSC